MPENHKSLPPSKPAPDGAVRRLGAPVIAGIAGFAVVVAGLLLLAFLLPPAYVLPVMAPEITAPSSIGLTQEQLTAQQQALLDTLAQKLPDALRETAKQYGDDRAYLAAISRVKIESCVFEEYAITVNLLLPSPKSENMETLGVESYRPHSGAQAYIRENYDKLCGLGGDIYTESYEVGLSLTEDRDGEPTLDWSLPDLYSVAYKYNLRFMSYMLDFMLEKGFDAAAFELLLPDFQNWDAHTGADCGQACTQEYFETLSAALSYDGVKIIDETVYHEGTIQKRLEDGFAATLAFDARSIAVNIGYPVFRVRLADSSALFDEVFNALGKYYRDGGGPVPASYEELEAEYQSFVRQKINGIYGPSGFQTDDTKAVESKEYYYFDWYELGEKGVAACPELVRDIRMYLSNYDFDLMFLADILHLAPH